MNSWEQHFRAMKPRQQVQFSGDVGFGLATPGDVLSYRQAWDLYVTGSIRAALSCADDFDKIAKSPPPGTTAETLSAFAANTRLLANNLFAQWNLYAGTPPDRMLLMSGDMLKTFQNVVIGVGNLNQTTKEWAPSIALPFPPSLDVQRSIIARLEGMSLVARGVLSAFVQSETAGLSAIAHSAGEAAGGIVKSTVGGAASGLFAGLGSWGLPVFVGGALVLYFLLRGSPIGMVARRLVR